MKIISLSNSDAADEYLSDEINKQLCNNILISGGSSFIGVLKNLNQKGTNFNFTLTDERDVQMSNQDSNINSYKSLGLKNLSFIGFEISNKPHKTLLNFEKILPNKFFDLAVLGVGEDGHIASIFPNEHEMLIESKNSFYCKSNLHKHNRFSLKLNYILNSKMIILYFRGAKKIKAFNQLIDKMTYPLNQFYNNNNLLVIQSN